uniref:M3 family metallopeptidase n=1 Tax=Eubacterium cellulosolvens TaxID=29322 RepID=UPI0004850538|nr:M3 family metallopeptidase [[Eubacterium] cellulosolvens]
MRNHSHKRIIEGRTEKHLLPEKMTICPSFFRKTARAAVACLTAFTLCVTPAAAAVKSGGEYYPVMSHCDKTWESRDPGSMDTVKLEKMLRELKERTSGDLAGSKNNKKIILALYKKIVKEYDRLVAGYCIAEIDSVKNVKDDDAMEYAQDLSEMATNAGDEVYVALKKALSTDEGKVLKAELGEGWTRVLLEYDEMSDEDKDLSVKKSELEAEYSQCAGDLADLSGEDEISEFENKIADLMYRMIEIQNKQAKNAGYDSYEEYAYSEIWGRDYTAKDIDKIEKYVKEDIVPLYRELTAAAYRSNAANSVGADFDEICDAVGPYLTKIDPELGNTFSYMRRNHLVDFSEDSRKAEEGFTMSMPYYGDAYIFNSPEGGYRDWQVLIHEFGHFNAAFHDDTPQLFSTMNLDVAEIQSQGLEALMTVYFPDIFGKRDGKALMIAELQMLLGSILQGFQVNEFEHLLREKPKMSAEELDQEFARLEGEYGLIDQSWVSDGDNFWTQIPHLYSQPFYYISYATSVIPALDIWYQSLDHRPEAVDAYMKISALNNAAYLEVLDEADLPNYLTEKGMKKVCAHIEELADRIQDGRIDNSSKDGSYVSETLIYVCYYLVGKGVGTLAE